MNSWLVPTAVATTLAIAVLGAGLAVRASIQARAANDARLIADQLSSRVGDCVGTRLEILSSIAREHAAGQLRPPDEFDARATAILESFPGFQAINRVDTDGTIVRVNPRAGNERALGRNLFDHPVAGPYLARAKAEDAVLITEPLELFQGGRGFAYYVPLRGPNGDPAGFLNGAFRSADLMDTCMGSQDDRRFNIAFYDGDLLVHARGAVPATSAKVASFQVRNRSWDVRVSPTTAAMQLSNDSRGWIAIGMVFALIVGLLMHAYLSARQGALSSARRHRKEMKKLAAVAESAGDFIGMADLDGHVQLLNGTARRLTGIERIEPGMKVEHLFPVEARAAVQEHMQQTARRGAANHELPLLDRRTQETVPVLFDTFLIHDPETGVPVAVGTIGRDLRRIRALEANLDQARRIEALGRLAGGIAHDFNNLLAIVRGGTALLRDDVGAAPALDDIESAAERATALVADLMSLGRRQEVPETALDLAVTVSDMHRLLQRLIPADRVFTLDIRSQPGVLASRSMIEQIVLNLVMNSVDATRSGGQIAVEIDAERDHAFISVIDNGTGIPADVIEHMFDAFYTTKGVGEGTGLGLATVAANVDSLGGNLDVQSTPGQGTRITATLPAVALPAPPIRIVSQQKAAATQKTRVLIVDDDDAVRRVTAKLVRREGFQVDVAEDGAAAVERLTAQQFDLVLTDAVMPRMGGGELIHWMASNTPETPVILVSGHTAYELDRLGPAATEVHVLAKPYTPDQLVNAIRTALASRETAA